MTGGVIPLRPPGSEFFAVQPGGDDGPVPYERTKRGAESALAHALLLSAGGGYQYVTLTEGRRTQVLCTIRNGLASWTQGKPQPYRTEWYPEPKDIRPGSPGGHIPELCSTAKHRDRGTKPRRNRNMPKAQPYEETVALMRAALEQEGLWAPPTRSRTSRH